jgi:1-acyl-sn-glycerol-3-phosphate acyltransferase
VLRLVFSFTRHLNERPVAMITFSELLLAPLPNLAGRRRALLRLLMLPNLALTEVAGRERLRGDAALAKRPVLIALNHNNAFETLFVPVLIMFLLGGRPVSFIIDWMFGHLPIVGRLMKLTDPVYAFHKPSRISFLERRRPARRYGVVETALLRLEEGGAIGIFPEGTRNRDLYELKRPKPGIGHLALASGAPVIPVGIRFTASARLGRMPLAGKMSVSIGEPMRFDSLVESYRACVGTGDMRGANILAGRVAAQVMRSISLLCGKRECREAQGVEMAANNRQTSEEPCPA